MTLLVVPRSMPTHLRILCGELEAGEGYGMAGAALGGARPTSPPAESRRTPVKSIAEMRAPGGPVMVLRGTADGATGGDVDFRHVRVVEGDELGLPRVSPLAFARDYLSTLRQLLGGGTVDYMGTTLTLHGVQLGIKAPPVPIYLAAMGPQMLRLSGELADGVLAGRIDRFFVPL